jgi:cell division protease FtsH
MITVYGMSKQAPNISLVEQNQNPFLGQMPGIAKHSERLEQIIDEEIQEMVHDCYQTAKKLLGKKRDRLEEMARILLEREKIDEKDIVAILGPRPEDAQADQEKTGSPSRPASNEKYAARGAIDTAESASEL